MCLVRKGVQQDAEAKDGGEGGEADGEKLWFAVGVTDFDIVVEV